MSNAPKPDESKDDALAALHGLQNSDEHDHHDEHDDPDEHIDAPSPAESAQASGFVGMLAKEGAGGNSDAANATGPTPPGRTDEIRMAREITVEPRTLPVPTTAPRRVKKTAQVPDWYHIATPIGYVLGAILLVLGLWALGATLYILMKTPTSQQDITYPLIDFNPDTETYDGLSKIAAFGLTLCLPVSYAMIWMSRTMQKRVAAANRANTK
jgi:hypothetical protein